MYNESVLFNKIEECGDVLEILEEAKKEGFDMETLSQPEALFQRIMYEEPSDEDLKRFFEIIDVNMVCREATYCEGRLCTMLDSVEEFDSAENFKEILEMYGGKHACELDEQKLWEMYEKDEGYAL